MLQRKTALVHSIRTDAALSDLSVATKFSADWLFLTMVVVYEFHNNDKVMTDLTAKQLAADVKSIMLNSGGPVAARTVYPILKRNHEELGLAIAIVPAPVAVTSMQARFNLEPKGIAPVWWAEVRLTSMLWAIKHSFDGQKEHPDFSQGGSWIHAFSERNGRP